MAKIKDLIKLFFMDQLNINDMQQRIAEQEIIMHRQAMFQQQIAEQQAMQHHQTAEQQALQLQQMAETVFLQQMLEQQQQEIMQHAINEGIKSVSPFYFGGYIQGPGFNPSDSMTHNNIMNHMF